MVGTQGGRDHQETTRRGRKGAPCSHRNPEEALTAEHNGQDPERLHRRAALEEDGLQSKKRSVGALERDEFRRAAWRVMVSERVEPQRLVFVDEMGANISLSVLRAWSRRGQRAYCSVPRNRGPNTTLLASMSMEGMGPSLAVEGATTATVFEAYVEKALAPTLRPGQVVVMDNLSLLTRELASGSSSKSATASLCTYRPTRPI